MIIQLCDTSLVTAVGFDSHQVFLLWYQSQVSTLFVQRRLSNDTKKKLVLHTIQPRQHIRHHKRRGDGLVKDGKPSRLVGWPGAIAAAIGSARLSLACAALSRVVGVLARVGALEDVDGACIESLS
jgi:hypothetical protein